MADTKRKLTIELTLADGMSTPAGKIRAQLGRLSADAKGLGRVLSAPFSAPLKGIQFLSEKVLSLRNLVAGLFVFRAAQAGLRELDDLTKHLDELGKLSDRINGTAESLTALDYALKLSGTSLTDIVPSLTAFSRQIDAARQGNAQTGLALRSLGVDIDKVRSGAIDYVEVLAQVADRYVALEDPTQRIAILTTAFGKAGAQLGPLLKAGAAGVRALAEEASRRGLVFSREDLKRAEDYQDSLLRISTAFRAAFNRAFLEAAPVVTAFFENLARFIDDNRGKLTALFLDVGKAFVRVLDIASDAAIGLVGILERIPGLVAVPDDVRKQYFDLAAQLQAIAVLRNRGGLDQAKRDAAAQPDFLKGLFPDASTIRAAGREFSLEFIAALTPKEAEIRAKFNELAAQMPGQLSASLRAQKDAIARQVREAFAAPGTQAAQTQIFRDILEQAGIRSDDDVIRAVGEGLISPEALLAGVRTGLFASGVVDRIVSEVRGSIAREVTRADPTALQAQAVSLRDLTALQRSLLELKQPTADVRLALAQLDDQAARADLAQKLIPQLVDGRISGELLAQAMDDLTTRTAAAMDSIRRGAEQDLVAFNIQMAQIGPQTRAAQVELAELQGKAQELSFREAAAAGRISLEQLAEALAKVREETQRTADLARGDFGEGFAAGARSALEALTDLSKLGEEAGRSLVDKGLGGLTDVLGTFLVSVHDGKAAFRDWSQDMLKLLGQLIAKWVALKAIQALGLPALAEGGIIPGNLLRVGNLPTRRYELGGVAGPNRPQLAIFGEGRGAEAFVPLPDGRSIPVTMTGGGGGGLTIVVQSIDSRDTARWFQENRGLIWQLQTHGVQNIAAVRQATGAAR